MAVAGQQGGSGSGNQGQQGGQQPGPGGGQGGTAPGTSPGTAPGDTSRLLGGESREQLFVGGREGQGPSEQSAAGSTLSQGEMRPYREVIGQYEQAARDHVERSSIPPAMKETVRQYFLELDQ